MEKIHLISEQGNQRVYIKDFSDKINVTFNKYKAMTFDTIEEAQLTANIVNKSQNKRVYTIAIMQYFDELETVCTLMMLVKDNQERIKSLESRIETLQKNTAELPSSKQPLQDGEITKKYMIDDDCMIEVWDSQFKTLRLYTVDFDEWELMKVGEVW